MLRRKPSRPCESDRVSPSRVVGVAFLPFAAVAEQAEVAVGVVAVVAPVQRIAVDAAAGIELADGVVLKAALFVVLVVADE